MQSRVGTSRVEPQRRVPWEVDYGGALVLFIYLGVEDRHVSGGSGRKPATTVPRATIIGTLVCAVLYVLSTLAIFGLVPGSELTNGRAILRGDSGNDWHSLVGQAIAFFAVVSGLARSMG